MQTTHGGPATSTSPDESGKKAARQLYRDRRRAFVSALNAGEREALLRDVAARCAPLTRLQAARAAPVASYAAIGNEMDPQFVEERFGPHAFPRIDGGRLRFHVAAWSELLPGPMGIPQPRADTPEIMPHLLLVPLIAATLDGVRLGQGGGYYDRTLALLQSQLPDGQALVTVGLAWDCQIADILPHEAHDIRLDWLATPTRLVECGRNG
ncbi:MAG: 5-formyltetrahydrofolate cyclo-ligase [Polymorphobacter sp.]|uniref:5-formyltetrahydrofolate cyclo-ligase n=1 Tax=Polymorphobacter sp. TaxID=1909290 RepID=UPI003A846D66